MKKRIKVTFLGTAGGRVVTFRLVRRSGGFLIDFGDTLFHVDPGPGAFVYLKEKGISYTSVDLIVLSHIHLDHSADLNTLIEACTDGGKRKGLGLVAPESAIKGRDRVLLPYLIKRLSFIETLKEGKEISFKGIPIKAVMRHTHHGVETYGLSFAKGVIVYLTCARYERRMLEAYPKNPNLLIINTTFYRKRPHIDHLSVEEVKELIAHCRPNLTVLTHFSMEMLQEGPERIARDLSRELSLEVISAHDGMELQVPA